jgi:hypothetical protein
MCFPTAMALAAESAAQPPVPNSLCHADEQIIFNCPIAKVTKLVSLCGSKTLDNRRGYLQYRFGRPGAVELQFPRERANTQLAFRYAHYFRAQVDRTEITFDNQDYRYTIFDDYEGDVKPPTREAGITISHHDVTGKEVQMACANKPTIHLGRLATIIPRDNDNPLNQ